MRYVKLFEDFSLELNEGAIPIYPPGNPYKPEASIQWTGVVKHFGTSAKTDWKKKDQSFTMVVDLDPDQYTANPKYRSKPLGTWKDKDMPLFTSDNPHYDEVEFDLVTVEPNDEKPNEPWLRIVDKNGIEFLVPPFKVLDIQKGSSMRDGIQSGDTYLIDGKRSKIIDYHNKNVEVVMQGGEKKLFPLAKWKSLNYLELDESEEEAADNDINENHTD